MLSTSNKSMDKAHVFLMNTGCLDVVALLRLNWQTNTKTKYWMKLFLNKT
ncbi:Uncharacterized protein APZ42_025299 [Daphnia magna]|uniref:Uncharacterized protein n=1 Tax=Daphnia magna TaxID=35525 RepID=A0A164T9P0_9CRUS|nr:Uncharacterized protein APZ42_025299 [Daphnia magna]